MKLLARTLAAVVLVALLAAPVQAGRRAASGTEILFQAFTWDAAVNGQQGVWYGHIGAQVEELALAGVTHVWFPPVSKSVAPQGYMPGDYYDLGEGSGKTLYGNKAELKDAIAKLGARGIASVADVVVNHRCASHQDAGVWNVFHHASGKMKWEKWALASGDYGGTGAQDSGEGFEAAPDVDHTNPRVRADIAEWLRWLRDEVGFTGLRFDYSKGYSAAAAKEYVEAAGAQFAVGEYWGNMEYSGSDLSPNQDRHRQTLCDWVDGTKGASMAFDFTTKGLLQEACRRTQYWRLKDAKGKAAGLIGWWPDHAVTFVDNHDTGSTQAHWPFPAERVGEGYAYIMTHPGIPTIFWDHYMAWGEPMRATIRKLAHLRHDLSIHRASQLEILVAENGKYAARVDGKLVVKLGPDAWQPGAGWALKMSGDRWAIWVRE